MLNAHERASQLRQRKKYCAISFSIVQQQKKKAEKSVNDGRIKTIKARGSTYVHSTGDTVLSWLSEEKLVS